MNISNCYEALTLIDQYCDPVEKCIDINYVNEYLCQNNSTCSSYIVLISQCYIDKCESTSSSSKEEGDEGNEGEEVDEVDVSGNIKPNIQKKPMYKYQDLSCFNENCKIWQESCSKHEKCDHVLQYSNIICNDIIQCMDLTYATYMACDGDNECGHIVSQSSICYYKSCETDCLTINCGSDWSSCIEHQQCSKALQLWYSDICDTMNCDHQNIQLELCQNDANCFLLFSTLLQCYDAYCYSETTSEPVINNVDHSSSDDTPSTTSNIDNNNNKNKNKNKIHKMTSSSAFSSSNDNEKPSKTSKIENKDEKDEKNKKNKKNKKDKKKKKTRVSL